MKSIMEEASSLAKAFAQAWEHAGKPIECTVKILAEPEKNFLGMTTKSAKIALFFNEAPAHSFGAKKSTSQPQAPRQEVKRNAPKPAQEQQPRQPQQRRAQQPRTERAQTERVQETRAERTQPERVVTERVKPVAPVTEQQLELIPSTPKVEATPRIRPTWSDEMSSVAQAWVKESLTIMGSDATFETSMARSTLTFTFNKPIIEDLEKERLLFRSWSHLIVQHVKQSFKVHGKELKIILKGSRS